MTLHLISIFTEETGSGGGEGASDSWHNYGKAQKKGKFHNLVSFNDRG